MKTRSYINMITTIYMYKVSRFIVPLSQLLDLLHVVISNTMHAQHIYDTAAIKGGHVMT